MRLADLRLDLGSTVFSRFNPPISSASPLFQGSNVRFLVMGNLLLCPQKILKR